MNFEMNYELQDEVVLLRPLHTDDFSHLLPFSLLEPELWQYSLSQAAGEQALKTYIESALAARIAKKEYAFIVFDKRQNSYAGSTRFYDMQLENKTLQLGYTWYGKQFQGTGLNKHCKYLLLEFAFERLGMERVEFRADNNNLRSMAAMRSIGCVLEGVLRANAAKPTGGRRDSAILSILKDEWFSSVKPHLLLMMK